MINQSIGVFTRVAAFMAVAMSAAAGQADFINGRAALAERVGQHEVSISASTVSTADVPAKRGFRWGGEDSEIPNTLLAELVITVDGVSLFVPLAGYVDLGNPTSVRLRALAGKRYEVTISGGDAAASYEAVLLIEKGWIVRRRVFNREFPQQAWEETKFHYNTSPN